MSVGGFGSAVAVDERDTIRANALRVLAEGQRLGCPGCCVCDAAAQVLADTEAQP